MLNFNLSHNGLDPYEQKYKRTTDVKNNLFENFYLTGIKQIPIKPKVPLHFDFSYKARVPKLNSYDKNYTSTFPNFKFNPEHIQEVDEKELLKQYHQDPVEVDVKFVSPTKPLSFRDTQLFNMREEEGVNNPLTQLRANAEANIPVNEWVGDISAQAKEYAAKKHINPDGTKVQTSPNTTQLNSTSNDSKMDTSTNESNLNSTSNDSNMNSITQEIPTYNISQPPDEIPNDLSNINVVNDSFDDGDDIIHRIMDHFTKQATEEEAGPTEEVKQPEVEESQRPKPPKQRKTKKKDKATEATEATGGWKADVGKKRKISSITRTGIYLNDKKKQKIDL